MYDELHLRLAADEADRFGPIYFQSASFRVVFLTSGPVQLYFDSFCKSMHASCPYF